MRDYDYENYGVTLSAPKYDKLNQPMPSRDELLARNSFGSVSDNKYLNRQKQLDGELERLIATQKRWGIRK